MKLEPPIMLPPHLPRTEYASCIVMTEPTTYYVECEKKQPFNEACKGLPMLDWYLCNQNYGSWMMLNKLRRSK